MQNIKKKNYSIYILCFNRNEKIYSGTLKEVDDFTSHFVSDNSIKKMLGIKKANIYILSSKGNIYDVLYYNNRVILDYNNFDKIFDEIKKINPDELDMYLYEKCKLEDALNNPNSKNIPIVNLHKAIINNNCFSILYSYLKNDYSLYRNLVIHFFFQGLPDKTLNKVSLDKKDEIVNIMNKVKEKFENIDAGLEEDNTSFDDIAYMIYSNSELEPDEKIEELDLLVNNSNNNNDLKVIYEYKRKI